MAHSFSPIHKPPAYKLVFEAIERDILTGVLPEGSALPTETALSEQFGVNRSTVREGIRLLEQTGLVGRGSAKRLIVVRPPSEEAAQRASRGLAQHGVSFQEVWECLQQFQPVAAKLTASRASSEALEEMKTVAHALGLETDTDLIVEHAVSFLQMVGRAVDNRVMLVTLQSLNLLIESSLRLVIDALPDAGERIAKAQTKLIEAFENRDEDQASVWMKRHIDDLKRGFDVAGVDIRSNIILPGRS